MSDKDIAEFEFYKRVKKLLPVVLIVWGILCSLITLTWKSKTFVDTLATKDDLQKILQPVTASVMRNTRLIDSTTLSSKQAHNYKILKMNEAYMIIQLD